MMVAESQGVALAARCEDALQAAMQSLEQTAPGRWTAHFRNCGAPPLMAQLTDGLLVLSGAVSPANSRSRWDLVKVNEALPGLVKFCLAPDGELSLRAEIPIEEETDLRRRLAQVGRGFAAALRPRRNEHRVAVPPEAVAPDLPKLVEASGWPCSSRRGDSCAVPLETRHAGQTALITAPAGAVQVCTELTSWDTLSANCREAVAVLLLTANARLRLARSIITEDELGGAAQLEVLYEAPVCAAELRAALEALTMGADLCAPAAESLQHEAAAQLFLALRGGPRGREDNQQTTERIT